ncbi:Hypothetical_protein [Hexamita inflata]|uniref:Hypothetical_protein n=1 Tax=Hexamita inflata TaxID=28002 RepID=A0AA86RKG4_9EUKA|nr:Hypothetical protein HINF_LOCUS62933 [Hexamita inflata]
MNIKLPKVLEQLNSRSNSVSLRLSGSFNSNKLSEPFMSQPQSTKIESPYKNSKSLLSKSPNVQQAPKSSPTTPVIKQKQEKQVEPKTTENDFENAKNVDIFLQKFKIPGIETINKEILKITKVSQKIEVNIERLIENQNRIISFVKK